MTSISSESAATVVVSCKQTRFHIDSPNYREVSILCPHKPPILSRMLIGYVWLR